MGVDYRPNYGIGYRIAEKDFDDDDMDFWDYLEELEMNDFEYFYNGNDIGGGERDWYIVLKDPFSDGLDLTKKKESLIEFLNENEISPIGDFGLCGGILIY